MAVTKITLAVWSVMGTLRNSPVAAWRIAKVKRKQDGREGWAAVLPDVWGLWHG